MSNDFSGDGNCMALWRFEDGALTADSQGSNTLTASGSPSADTVNFKEGAASCDFEEFDVDRFFIATADLDAGYPFKLGDSTKKISICFWVKFESLPSPGNSMSLYHIGDPGTSNATFYIVALNTAGTTAFQFAIGYNGGASWESVNHGTGISAGIWYHVAITYQDSDKSYNMRIWDDNGSALLGGSEVGGNTTNNINIETDYVRIAHKHDGSVRNEFDGLIDEMVPFNDILSPGEIDQIRGGVYNIMVSHWAKVLTANPDNIAVNEYCKFVAKDVIGRSYSEVKTDLGLGSGNSPQFTGIELGHATDTTITRASAGNLNIEGKLVYRADGTDVPIGDGGTGQSTAQLAINALSTVGAATNEHVLTKDTGTGNAIWKVGGAGGVGSGDQYIDRGDPATADWEETGSKAVLDTDGAWHDLDCSGIVPAGATAIAFRLNIRDSFVSAFFLLRKNGNSNDASAQGQRMTTADATIENYIIVHCDSNRIVEYIGYNTSFTRIHLTVVGWFVPAGTSNGKVKVDTDATADYLGAAFNDGALRSSTGLTYTDGGNFITLAVDVGIADGKVLKVDHVSPVDNDYAKFTVSGLEGRSYAEVLGDLSGQAAAAFDLNGQDLTNGGVIFLTEQAAAEAHIAGKGQYWVKNDAPASPHFDDDVGGDIPLDNRFVDRGDPANWDWEVGDVTTDGDYHDLDCSGIVPSNAIAIVFGVEIQDDLTDVSLNMRTNGNVNTKNNSFIRSIVAGTSSNADIIVACDSSQVVEYRFTNTTWTVVRITVKGWFLA